MRLLALAIRFEGSLRQGVVKDYAELARLGRISRARISQIANLAVLAPDIQEDILSNRARNRAVIPSSAALAADRAGAELAQATAAVGSADACPSRLLARPLRHTR